MRRQFPVARFQPEIFLMVAHHRQQNFVGQREVSWIEIADDYARVFVEICHQLQQLGIFMSVQATATGERANLRRDFALALCGSTQYKVFL